MIPTRVLVFPEPYSDTSLENCWSVPPVMESINAIRDGMWSSWTALLRCEEAVAPLEYIPDLWRLIC